MMPRDDIVEKVRAINRGGGNYADIIRAVAEEDGVNLSVPQINGYLGLGTDSYKPAPTRHPAEPYRNAPVKPPALLQARLQFWDILPPNEYIPVEEPPAEVHPTESSRGTGKTKKSVGPLTYILTGGLLGAVTAGSFVTAALVEQHREGAKDRREYEARQAAGGTLHSQYALIKIGDTYVVDLDHDKRPDGTIRSSAFDAAGRILALGGEYDARSLLRSLFDINADEFIIKSPEHILAIKGREFVVFKAGMSGLSVNTDVNIAWHQINRQILNTLASDTSSEQKVQSIESAMRSDPEASLAAVRMLLGKNIGNYSTQEAFDMSVTDIFSQLAQDNMAAAVTGLAGLNVGSMANVIVFLGAPYMARIALGLDPFPPGSAVSSTSGEGGIYGRNDGRGPYFIRDPLSDGQVIGPFSTYNEAYVELGRLRETKRNEYRKREVQTTTDPRTGMTRTDYIIGTEEQAEEERFRRDIEAGNRQLEQDVNTAIRQAQQGFDDLAKGVQKGLEDLFKPK